MAELKVNEITTSTVNANDKVYAFSNLESKAPEVKDLLGAAPGVIALGTCTTSSSTAAKEVTSDNWTGKGGESILIHFSFANTASDITLSINEGTALPVYAANSNGLRLGNGSISESADVLFTMNETGTKFFAYVDVVAKSANYNTHADGETTYNKTQIDGKEATLQNQITANAGNIATIQGSDTTKSMRTIAEEVVNALPAVYTPKGTVAFANLPALADCSIGWVYNISDGFTTTSDFIEGAGIVKEAGTNIAIIDSDGNGTKKYDVLSGAVDLSGYQTKNLSQPISSYTTVEAALQGIISSQMALVAGSAAGDVPLNGAALGTTDDNIIVTDTNGNLKPSGIVVGSAAGKTAGNAAGNVPYNSNALGTTVGGIITADATGIYNCGKTPETLIKVGNASTVCSTSKAIAAKEVNISGFSLYTGVTVKVMFTYGNSGENPTLNVNRTGDKAIKVIRAGNKEVPINHTGYWCDASSTSSEMWQPNTILELMYDGTDWVIIGNPVVESYYASNKGYSVYADGLIEQWLFDGNVTTVSTQGDFYLPIYFSNKNYAVIGKGMRGGSSNTDFNLAVKDKNWFQLSATVYAWNFLCIGY